MNELYELYDSMNLKNFNDKKININKMKTKKPIKIKKRYENKRRK